MQGNIEGKDIQLENLGKLIKGQRKLLGLKQQEVADLIGISVQHYSRIERGEYTPSLQTFFRLTEALHIDLSPLRMKNESVSSTMYEIMSLLGNLSSTKQKAVLSFLKTMGAPAQV